MARLGLYSGHVPPELAEQNDLVGKLLQVLDGLQERKEQEVRRYADSFDPRTAHDLQTLRHYVDEWGGEYRTDTSHASLECLYLHKDFIFNMRGTHAGLRQWLQCISQAEEVAVDYTPPYPFLHFHTLPDGVLPDGQDIANELSPPEGKRPYLVPTLLGDTWAHGYSTVVVTLTNAYNKSDDFARWLEKTLPRYLPGGDENTINITVNLL
jgi:hypothetical protein